MFVSKDENINQIKDKLYYKLKEKFPQLRFGLKYYPRTEKQTWDYMIVRVLNKNVKETTQREIDNLCFELQKMRGLEPLNKDGLVDYIDSECDNTFCNQLTFDE